jgi:hypothetical protein
MFKRKNELHVALPAEVNPKVYKCKYNMRTGLDDVDAEKSASS